MSSLEWPYNLLKTLLGDDWTDTLGVEFNTLLASLTYVISTCLRDHPEAQTVLYHYYKIGTPIGTIAREQGVTLESARKKLRTAESLIQRRFDRNMLIHGIDNYVLALKIESRYDEKSAISDPENGSHRAASESIKTLGLTPATEKMLDDNGVETVGDLMWYTNRYCMKHMEGITKAMIDNIQRRLQVNGYYYRHLDDHGFRERRFYDWMYN